jgi:plasmid maintenance system antidote protein VapI
MNMLVKDFLEENGIKISKVAKDLGKSRTFVSLVVHGHKTSRPVAQHIESILKVPQGSLFPYVKNK